MKAVILSRIAFEDISPRTSLWALPPLPILSAFRVWRHLSRTWRHRSRTWRRPRQSRLRCSPQQRLRTRYIPVWWWPRDRPRRPRSVRPATRSSASRRPRTSPRKNAPDVHFPSDINYRWDCRHISDILKSVCWQALILFLTMKLGFYKSTFSQYPPSHLQDYSTYVQQFQVWVSSRFYPCFDPKWSLLWSKWMVHEKMVSALVVVGLEPKFSWMWAVCLP